ncbi:transcriptional regulator [Streptomyces sp. Act143]|uniref:helix-turn-helix transcriptional regulator n=1 Tax=Streptomyces sp. Act143 TaxID=2200760 RepID=UPI000D677BC3|nr:YafY family protein [Streptomyces sp. Act143]PWI14282.1 transcriptional regulator [Streptomyces sp. Act143]
MKSSRLVSILLLLQTRGRMTAAQLAAELEVSVRTVYRDVEALGAAGVPLYGDAGHAGGYRLLDGYRTRLTGLTADEAEALFLAGAPGPAAELGLGSVLAAAQLKLRAALPAELRAHADRVSARFHLDAPGWYAETDDTPYLPAVADAVWNGRVLHVRYRRWARPTDVERRLEPYGLVLKAGRWYVVAGPGPRTYRVDQILELAAADEEFDRPDDFDLAAYWTAYQRDFHERLYREEALVRLAPGVTHPRATTYGPEQGDGWRQARVPVESVDRALSELLSMGTGVEVLEPPELRERLARTVRELAARYAG